jgi:asparagine synthase (glutamine-hydrolysing)
LADVEVGVFLSSGVDSGAILGLAAEFGARSPRAVTLAFDEFRGTADDESPLAAEVAARYGSEHVVRRVGEAEFRADLPTILAAMDQPSIDGVNTWFVSKAAKEAGLKVVLSGLGGDELLAGYRSFVDVPRWHRRLHLLGAVPALPWLSESLMPAIAPALLRRQPKARHLLRYSRTLAGAYLLKRARFLPSEMAEMLDPEVIEEGLRRLQPLDRVGATLVPDPGSDNGRLCALESTHYMRDQLLRDADWAGMAHGLEIRTPLVDSVLLAKVAGSLSRLQPGEGKRALASAPATPLPDSVTQREKTGFRVPTGEWMQKHSDQATRGGLRSSHGEVSRSWSRFVIQ